MAVRLDPFRNITNVHFGGFPEMTLFIRYQVVDSNDAVNGSFSGSIGLVFPETPGWISNPDPGLGGVGGDVARCNIDVKRTIATGELVESFDVTLNVNPVDEFTTEWSAELYVFGDGPFPPEYGSDPPSNWGRLVGRFPPPYGDGGVQTLILRWHRSAPDDFPDGYPGTPYIEVIQEPPDAS